MRFRKKPVVIEATQYDGTNDTIPGLCTGQCVKNGWEISATAHIHTLEGAMTVSPGDWIITGIKGERYPCKPDIFESTYEPVAPSHKETQE